MKSKQRSCRHCGCNDCQACPGGCWWTGDTLCSACTPDVDQAITAMCLVSATQHVTDDQVKSWTTDERADAFHWAIAVHYRASDNDVVVPPQPTFTKLGKAPSNPPPMPYKPYA